MWQERSIAREKEGEIEPIDIRSPHAREGGEEGQRERNSWQKQSTYLPSSSFSRSFARSSVRPFVHSLAGTNCSFLVRCKSVLTMFSYGFLSCLFVASLEALHPSCSLLESKLNHYASRQDQRSTSWYERTLCQGLPNRTFCCPDSNIDQIHQMASADLIQLFQKHLMPIEQSATQISATWNGQLHSPS